VGGEIDNIDADTKELFSKPTPTSDVRLDKWARKHVPGFVRVLPRDELVNETPKPGSSWVLNLDPHYERGGTHWTALYVAKRRPQLYYFDSYGLPPPKDVMNLGRKYGLGVVRSGVRWQRYEKEVNCGQRSVAALRELARAPDDYVAMQKLANARP
jgi:hypothetical protein